MNAYRPIARNFILLIWFLGLAVVPILLLLPHQRGERFETMPVLLTSALAAIAGTRKIYLLRSHVSGQSRYVTLGFLVTFATLIQLGVRAGIVVGIASALSADFSTWWWDKRRANTSHNRLVGHQVLFNIANVTITAFCSGSLYGALNQSVGTVTVKSVPAILISMTLYFLLNTGLIAAVLALCLKQSFRAHWQTFLWSFPLHLAGAATLALSLMNPFNVEMLLIAASIAFFAYNYYNLYGESVAQKQAHIDELEAGKEMLSELYLSTVKSLATAIAAKDQYTHAHIHRVQHYALALARQLGLNSHEMQAIRTGAVLHDIGKLGVPDYVLLKPGRLTPDEFEKMKRHPVIGVEILEPVQFPWPVMSIVRNHHERWDGKGYPDGLAGKEIPLGARVLTVADVYDALTSARPYRPAWSHQKAVDFLITEAGKQFDSEMVQAFLEIVDEANVTLHAVEVDVTSEYFNTIFPSTPGGDFVNNASRQIGRTASELWVLYEVSQALNNAAPILERLNLLSRKLTSIVPNTTCAFVLDATLFKDPPQNRSLNLSKDSPTDSAGDSVAGAVECEHETRLPSLRLATAAGANAEMLTIAPLTYAHKISQLSARIDKVYRGVYLEQRIDERSEPGIDAHAYLPLPVRSQLFLPLIHEGEQLGVLTFYHRDADAFTLDDEHLLTIIADQVEAALYQDREYDRTLSDANTDALTGLHNLRYLRFRIESLIQNENLTSQENSLRAASSFRNDSFVLLYLDLDNFKHINTLYGHPAGSRVLAEVAQLLPKELRPTDLAVRYGGDEFVIVLPQTSEAGAKEVAQRIRTTIQRYRPTFLPEFSASSRLDVSFGIACYPADGNNMEELVAVADARMYEMKAVQKLASRPDYWLDTSVVATILQRWPSKFDLHLPEIV